MLTFFVKVWRIILALFAIFLFIAGSVIVYKTKGLTYLIIAFVSIIVVLIIVFTLEKLRKKGIVSKF